MSEGARDIVNDSTEPVLEDTIGILSEQIKVGVGDPTSPYAGQLLSEEDERVLQPDGSRNALLAPWGDVPTGLYLTVAASTGNLRSADRPPMGGGQDYVGRFKGKPVWLQVAAFRGKPTYNCDLYGVSLELPADLGADPLKQQYLMEWLRDTVQECLSPFGLPTGNKKAKARLVAHVAEAGEAAIRGTGL